MAVLQLYVHICNSIIKCRIFSYDSYRKVHIGQNMAQMVSIQNEIILRITGFLEFSRHPVFYKLQDMTFRKLDLFPFSGEEGKVPTQLDPIERANFNNWSPSHEDGNRSNFQNVVFWFLELRTMEKVKKLRNSECYTVS
jgi:hypothetical protein